MDMAEIGVRTRARGLAAESSGPAKRRKVGGEEPEFSSSLVEFTRPRQVTENSVSAECLTDPDDHCSDNVTASCCSSNRSNELSNEELQFPDLELEQESVGIQNLTNNSVCRERRKTTPVSELRAETEEMESTARPLRENSQRQSTAEMPSETELEEFFSVAEKDLEKKFGDKYNFDIANDKPLEGRYEWVRLKL